MSEYLDLTVYHWPRLNKQQRSDILQRPELESDQSFRDGVSAIIRGVRRHGDQSLLNLTEQLDKVRLERLEVPAEQWREAEKGLPAELRTAMARATARIRGFHAHALPQPFAMNTAPGMLCETHYQPIRTVGLYVPAGSAPLPSTMLMLGIPAQLAGCQQLIVCSPPNKQGEIDPAVLSAARICGVDRVFSIGGAQAIAAMAYGTTSIPKCDKLFGPGNRWVTEAKQQVSIDPQGAAIDMPAGPSEVLVITDGSTSSQWVAADLLSQAEHGPDSQVVLVTTAGKQLPDIAEAINSQLAKLPRAETATRALSNSRVIVVDDLQQALQVSNQYAPEHLILACQNGRELVADVQVAGSVFVGQYTPESLGDYCSGTNHVLPTSGWARNHGSLSTADFMNRMTVQEATPEGLQNIGPDAVTMARHEQLDAHALAVELRLSAINTAAAERISDELADDDIQWDIN